MQGGSAEAFSRRDLLSLIGTVAAAMFPALELSAALKSAADDMLPGSGSPFLVASLLGLVTITTLNFYSASLTLLSVADSIRPLKPTVAQRLLTLVGLLAASSMIALASSPHFAAQFGDNGDFDHLSREVHAAMPFMPRRDHLTLIPPLKLAQTYLGNLGNLA